MTSEAVIDARRSTSRRISIDDRTLWLARAQLEQRHYLEGLGLRSTKPVIITTGSTAKPNVLGECYPSDKSVALIVVSNRICKATTALHVLLHELIHAALPEDERHGVAFRAWAGCAGLVGPVGATKAGPGLLKRHWSLAKQLGPYPPAENVYVVTEQGWAVV